MPAAKGLRRPQEGEEEERKEGRKIDETKGRSCGTMCNISTC